MHAFCIDSEKEGSMKERGSEIGKLMELVRDINIAMVVTRRADGRLVSRPMSVQEKSAPGADFWFVTLRDTDKVAEVQADPQVNLTFYKDRTREWVSVSGTAFTTDDRDLIRQLYRPDWKIWFDDQGDPRHGTPDDPRMMLIGVRAESAHFMTVDKPQVVVLFELLKGAVTGTSPEIGEMHEVSGPVRGR
jgi:general stress protein 26